MFWTGLEIYFFYIYLYVVERTNKETQVVYNNALSKAIDVSVIRMNYYRLTTIKLNFKKRRPKVVKYSLQNAKVKYTELY